MWGRSGGNPAEGRSAARPLTGRRPPSPPGTRLWHAAVARSAARTPGPPATEGSGAGEPVGERGRYPGRRLEVGWGCPAIPRPKGRREGLASGEVRGRGGGPAGPGRRGLLGSGRGAAAPVGLKELVWVVLGPEGLE